MPSSCWVVAVTLYSVGPHQMSSFYTYIFCYNLDINFIMTASHGET